MAIENQNTVTTITAGEDLSTHQYKVVAVVDGQRAATPEESTGVLINKPASGEFAALVYQGETKVYAGGAIAVGDKLTVTTGGLVTAAGSEDGVIGESKGTATGSGSLVNALVSFPNATARTQNFVTALSAAGATLLAGVAVALDDQAPANNAEEFAGVAQSAITSGGTGNLVMCGITPALMADTTSAGDGLTIATSGYFSIADSGDNVVARCITNTASGAAGLSFVSAHPGYLFT